MNTESVLEDVVLVLVTLNLCVYKENCLVFHNTLACDSY